VTRANAKAVITGFGAQPGTHVTVTMFFARAGEITKDVIVRDNTDEYVRYYFFPCAATAAIATFAASGSKYSPPLTIWLKVFI
jgi:hypothetical protein